MKDFWNQPAWLPIDPPSKKLPLTANKLHAVVKELDVEKSPRYAAVDGKTKCNIFVWDVTRAMGCEIPHWVTHLPDGAPTSPGSTNAELSANGIVRWLETRGQESYGWTEVDKATAFDAAARNHVVILGWDAGGRKTGHVAILLPEGTIAQAGAKNFVGGTARQGFGDKLPNVRYFVQALHRHAE